MGERPNPWPWLLVAALFVGGVVAAACTAWRQAILSGNDPTDLITPAVPWPAEHALMSGLIAGAVVLVVGRVAVWGRNVEAGARDRRG